MGCGVIVVDIDCFANENFGFVDTGVCAVKGGRFDLGGVFGVCGVKGGLAWLEGVSCVFVEGGYILV